MANIRVRRWNSCAGKYEEEIIPEEYRRTREDGWKHPDEVIGTDVTEEFEALPEREPAEEPIPVEIPEEAEAEPA